MQSSPQMKNSSITMPISYLR